jgi:hypothetical protein
MPAAVRHTWMFRTAAAVFLALGAAWLWTALVTDFRPGLRPWTLGQGIGGVIIGALLLRPHKAGILLSAAVAALVALAAILFVPKVRGPGILALAALALLCAVYAVLSLRAVFAKQTTAA